jgi:hypothetical protein
MYYKMQEGLGQTTFQFCEMDEFEGTPTEDDKMLGYDTVSTASPVTRFVALEDFRRKVILFEPPRNVTEDVILNVMLLAVECKPCIPRAIRMGHLRGGAGLCSSIPLRILQPSRRFHPQKGRERN